MTRDFENSELLSAYLDGELNAEERSSVQRQLRDNPQWQQMLEDLSTLRQQLQSLPEVAPAEDFTERILRRAERAMLSEPGSSELDPVAQPEPVPADREEVQQNERPSTEDVKTVIADGAPNHTGDWRFPSLAIATLAASMLIMVVYFAGRDNEAGTTNGRLAMHQPAASDGVPAAERGEHEFKQDISPVLSGADRPHNSAEMRAMQLEMNDAASDRVSKMAAEAKSRGFDGDNNAGRKNAGRNNAGRNNAGRNNATGGGLGASGFGGGGFGGGGATSGEARDDGTGRIRKLAEGASLSKSPQPVTIERAADKATDKGAASITRAVAGENRVRRFAVDSANAENLLVVEISLGDAQGRAQVLRYLRGQTLSAVSESAVSESAVSESAVSESADSTTMARTIQKKTQDSVRRSPGTSSDDQAESDRAKADSDGKVKRDRFAAEKVPAKGVEALTLRELKSDLELVMVEGLPAELSVTLTKVASINGVELRMHQESKNSAPGHFAQVSPVEFLKRYTRGTAIGGAAGTSRPGVVKSGKPLVPAAAQRAGGAEPTDNVQLQASAGAQPRKESAAKVSRSAASTPRPAAPAPTAPAPAPAGAAATGSTAGLREPAAGAPAQPLPSSRGRRQANGHPAGREQFGKGGRADNRGGAVGNKRSRQATPAATEGVADAAIRKAVKSAVRRAEDGSKDSALRVQPQRSSPASGGSLGETRKSERVPPAPAQNSTQNSAKKKDPKSVDTNRDANGESPATVAMKLAKKQAELKKQTESTRDGAGAIDRDVAAQSAQAAIRPVRVLIILRTRSK